MAHDGITSMVSTDAGSDVAVAEVARLLKERGATVATAESCTGGRIAAALTAAAGSSEYFMGGVVAYSNDVKIAALGVDSETLARHGAVSEEVAKEMAIGALRLTGADYTIATTGVAGPGGGSPAKPVGTVWIAVASAATDPTTRPVPVIANPDKGEAIQRSSIGVPVDCFAAPRLAMTEAENAVVEAHCDKNAKIEARLHHFSGTRAEVMAAAVRAALAMLRDVIEA